MQKFGDLIVKKYDAQDGFTLIEVVIAIFLLVVAILGAAGMQITSIEGNSRAIRMTDAVTLGSDRLERFMGLQYDDADLDDVSNTGTNAGVTGLNNTDVVGQLADGGPLVDGEYTIFWNVATDYPLFGTKTVRVLIQRSDQGTLKTITQDFIKMEPI
jgi:prepilin-type N-terminal cleavage/methylation domain-containing protein